jgi:hypothetical protein
MKHADRRRSRPGRRSRPSAAVAREVAAVLAVVGRVFGDVELIAVCPLAVAQFNTHITELAARRDDAPSSRAEPMLQLSMEIDE